MKITVYWREQTDYSQEFEVDDDFESLSEEAQYDVAISCIVEQGDFTMVDSVNERDVMGIEVIK